MSIASKYWWTGKHVGNIALVLAVVLATSACTTPQANNKPVTGRPGSGIQPLVRIAPIYPLDAKRYGDAGACVSAQLTLTRAGRVAYFKVVGAYPTIRNVKEYGFVRAIRGTMKGWSFSAQPKDVDAVSHRTVQQKWTFLKVPPGTASIAEALSMVCRQPYLLTLKAIPIQSASLSQLESSELDDTSKRKKETGNVTGIIVKLPQAMYITRFWQGAGNVRVRFCVDPQERIANVVLSGGTPKSQAVALAAIDELPATAERFQHKVSQPQQLSTISVTGWRAGDESRVRRAAQDEKKAIDSGKPQWACGLRLNVHLFSKPKGQTIGLIKRTSFGQLSDESTMPPIIASHSPHQKLVVPTDAKFHEEARIEVEFCITPDGKPTVAHVVSAKPAKIFNHAALKVVAGWRFAHRAAKMCNVYQWVGFKVPHRAGSA